MGEVGISSEYVLCDAALLPFRDDVFDVVCFLDSLRCLKGNIPERFLEEAWRTLRSGGTLYITGLDKVTFKGKVLPIFKDARLPISWGSYVPTDRSEPWIDEEPTYEDLSAGRKFKYVGILPEHVARELLSECGVKSKTLWEVDQEEGYKFHRYLIVARKTQRLDYCQCDLKSCRG